MVCSSEHYRNLANRLMALRVVFSTGSEGARYLELFDEFLSVDEFELALHGLCDFLNEPTAAAPSNVVVDQIQALHVEMELNDNCAERLRSKLGR